MFQPANLLREARRQKDLPDQPVPAVCLLDPDGDIVRHLAATSTGRRHPGWACYHTDMWTTHLSTAHQTPGPADPDDPTNELEIGVVGMAVGAPFAVLVAEQLAASGARLIISITSAGQIRALAPPPYFLLIQRAWRDEDTSAHYQPPATWSHLPAHLASQLSGQVLAGTTESILTGVSWTTDAPYRETATAIGDATRAEVDCVEMEAAALYAYAAATGRDVVCLAHVTNTMAAHGDDFDKGSANGATAALAVTGAIARALHHR